LHHIFAMLDITMTIFIIMIVVVAILIVYSFAIRLQREKVLRRFVTSLHVIDRELVLPETIPIELGYVSVKCLWKSSGRSRYYSCKFNVSGKEVKEVSKVDVNSICNNPFYIYVNQSNEVLALAPGFRVSAGKYKGIYVLCLDSSKIPSTAIELIAHSNSEKAVGRVEVSTEGYEALVHWAFEAPREKKVVFDDKAGLYRVVEEYRGKPKARSARIELCFLTPRANMECRRVAVASKPGEESRGFHRYVVKEGIVVFHKDLLSNSAFKVFAKAVEPQYRSIIAGYCQGCVRAKLVLDIPVGRDVVVEKDI